MSISLPPKLNAKKPKRDNRIRCASHLRWIRSHACSVSNCDITPIEAAHIRKGSDGATGMKPSDIYSISLCHVHHKQQHAIGETSFALKHNLDLLALAAEFWRQSPYRKRVEAKMRRAA